jgi:hypothetical protein
MRRAFNAVKSLIKDPENKGYIKYNNTGPRGGFTMAVNSRDVRKDHFNFAIVMKVINHHLFKTGENIRDVNQWKS